MQGGPFRPRASTTSLNGSTNGSFGSHLLLDKSQSRRPSSGELSPTRGRTLQRVPAHDRVISRASSRRRTIAGTQAEDGISATAQHLFRRDFTQTPEEYDETILEPRPVERCRANLSEQLHRASSYASSVDLHLGDRRDIFAVMGLCRFCTRSVALPKSFWKGLIPYLDFNIYRALRLTCRTWSAAVTHARPIVVAPACKLPMEILERIYLNLTPMDFNAARHTCRAWMIASLRERLLIHILKLGGWLQASRQDRIQLERLQDTLGKPRTSDGVGDEWLLSKRLATECSLEFGWTGNGLAEHWYDAKSSNPTYTGRSLNLTSQASFSDLSHGCTPGRALHFTVSACNNFVLVSQGCNVYVYTLLHDVYGTSHQYGGQISLFARIRCPQRVLAVSMDTSSARFALAALLEDRTGFVSDVTASNVDTSEASDSVSWSSKTASRADTRNSWTSKQSADGISAANQYSGRRDVLVPYGSRSIYRNLCASGDPPQSVAICPHRHCVAFGSSTGVELHWKDALTGQGLSRWFPLPSPSQFLYFMPQTRNAYDNPGRREKLRLLSSADFPAENDGSRPRLISSLENYSHQHWGKEGVRALGSVVNTKHTAEYYKAIPLSDGSVLFLDAVTACLCLAKDLKPRSGDASNTHLIRRFMFEGSRPSVYVAGADLRWGFKLVAAFEDRIFLFVVPGDVFNQESNAIEHEELLLIHGDALGGPAPGRIRGIEVGQVPNLMDLALDSTCGDLTLWAFAEDGMACTWQLAGGGRPILKRKVLNDGTIHIITDENGDIIMQDAVPDGSIESPRLVGSQDRDHEDDRLVDEEGDTVMPDAGPEDEGYVSDNEYAQAGGAFAIHAPPLWGRWSDDDHDWVPEYLAENGGDIDDEGLGVDVLELCRLECEIISG